MLVDGFEWEQLNVRADIFILVNANIQKYVFGNEIYI